MKNPFHVPVKLDLRAGELVRVRSQIEVLSTLNKEGALNGLPFMPEMLQYCGKTFKVYKRADKTCDTISGNYGSRRMYDVVSLENVRCCGEAHGECDATCLIYWKEDWLKRENDPKIISQVNKSYISAVPLTETELFQSTKLDASVGGENEAIYRCQATELLKASYPLAWWDIRQYVREIRSKNTNIVDFARVMFFGIVNFLHEKLRGWRRYPFLDSKLLGDNIDSTKGELNIQAGEYVQIKTKEEILCTLDNRYRNRGLWFDMEMVKYCGRTVKVLKRVKKIINEKTGEIINIKNGSVILEGVVCCGEFSNNRLLCTRSIYPFWREIWLERIQSLSPGPGEIPK